MATGDLGLFMATMVASPQAVSLGLAEFIAREHYGVTAKAERLTGERDENFRLTAADGPRYVLKVASAAEKKAVTDLATAALLHVEQHDPSFPCPRVRRDRAGRTLVRITDEAGAKRIARLVTYLDGRPLRHASRSRSQRQACGTLSARLGRVLATFQHPAMHRMLAWDLQNVPLLRPLLADLPDLPHAAFVAGFIDWFEARITPRLGSVRHQFIHNDCNDGNVLVDPADDSVVAGVIDFGDCVHTVLVADLAIAAVAQITDLATAPEAVEDIARSYHEILPLLAAERALLGPLIAARIVTGILLPSWHRARNPSAGHFAAFDDTHIARRVALATRFKDVTIELG